MSSNLARAISLLHTLLEQGVTEFCVCAGSRNSPLIEALGCAQQPKLKIYWFFEERSAAFFAVGRSKRTLQPTAVITTSGTAAAELLPAAIEAHYAGVSLVLVTADRPAHYRGTGSPQTIEQIGLFSHYVAATYDLKPEGATNIDVRVARPVHINIGFDEPLLDHPLAEFCLSPLAALQPVPAKAPSSKHRTPLLKRPLVLLGRIDERERADIEALLLQWQAPIYAEALSGLRSSAKLRPLFLKSGDRLLSTSVAGEMDGVIRIGSVPTVRFWRDLEKMAIPVWHFSTVPFAGLSRGELMCASDLSRLLAETVRIEVESSWSQRLWSLDREQSQGLERLLLEQPSSEVAWFRFLSQMIHGRVFLGNSLPIREWDLASDYQSKVVEVEASRGANGIDGQLSTFWGYADRDECWGIFGDLTTLYDLSSPWITRQLPESPWRLVIINNFGGQIFSRLFENPRFVNAHPIEFGSWAKMWNLPYEKLQGPPPREWRSPAQTVIEIQPDSSASERFWQGYGALWKNL